MTTISGWSGSGVLPEGRERLVQSLEQCGDPLRVLARGVEADDVVPGEVHVEARRQVGEDPPAEIARRFPRRFVGQGGAGHDGLGRQEFIPLVGKFEEHAAVNGFDHDPAGECADARGLPGLDRRERPRLGCGRAGHERAEAGQQADRPACQRRRQHGLIPVGTGDGTARAGDVCSMPDPVYCP
jgi:hypothetical protein